MTVKLWIIIGVISVVVLSFAFLQFGGLIKQWTHRDDIKNVQDLLKNERDELLKQKALNEQTLKEYEATQNAVRNLSQEILRLRKDADKSKQEALAALQKQQAKESLVLDLEQKVKELEIQLKQKKLIPSLEEAQRELVKYGIQ